MVTGRLRSEPPFASRFDAGRTRPWRPWRSRRAEALVHLQRIYREQVAVGLVACRRTRPAIARLAEVRPTLDTARGQEVGLCASILRHAVGAGGNVSATTRSRSGRRGKPIRRPPQRVRRPCYLVGSVLSLGGTTTSFAGGSSSPRSLFSLSVTVMIIPDVSSGSMRCRSIALTCARCCEV